VVKLLPPEMEVVSERLGHASVVLTLDTYSHVLPTMQEAASQKLERILFGSVSLAIQHYSESSPVIGHPIR
jgi:hypothetical protein